MMHHTRKHAVRGISTDNPKCRLRANHNDGEVLVTAKIHTAVRR